MKFGIQLFGILKDEHTDTIGKLTELHNIGFKRIEPCIALEPISGFEHVIWPLDWFETHASQIQALGFEIPSAHIFSQNLTASVQTLIHLSEQYGIHQFVVKMPQDLSAVSLQQTALTYMQIADALSDAGASLLLHNEDAEIRTRIHGKTAYEYLLELCLGKVYAQVDVGWAYAGGEDPEALLWRLGSSVRSLHYKDFHKADDKFIPTMVGNGDVDTAACFQFARAMGIPQIVDQDDFVADPCQEMTDCLNRLKSLSQVRDHSVSYLNTLDTETGEVQVLRRYEKVIEAPNWLKNQNTILYNSEGHIWRLDLDTGNEEMIESGKCDNCNNDHVVSADEQSLAVSHSPKDAPWASRVYILPLTGGIPRLVTENSPSYLHGWSPDGSSLSYCAFRDHDGKMEVDIYTSPAEGGGETRLTLGGFNDGPEYSPDGKQIWFNSTRSGLMQIWRMNADGTDQTQMTTNERNNWFGHISPDGQKVVYLSYRKDDLEANEHLPNMQVELWMMNSDGSNPHRLISLFGGQGSINVNSWAKDNRHIAFVSYELLHH